MKKITLSSRTIGALLGKSKWKTPWETFVEKITGRNNFCTTTAMSHGIKYENEALKQYENHTGNKVDGKGKLIVHPEYSYITGKIDGFVDDSGILLEVKCPYTKKFPDPNEEEWDIDDFYWVQVQIYMEIMRVNETHFIEYYRDSNRSFFRYKSIYRDSEWFAGVYPKIEKYYDEIIQYKEIGIDNHPIYKMIGEWELERQVSG